MRLSLVMPCYNAARFVRECLDSIRAQKFENWECICVDDGSTDGSFDILEEYSKKDDRFVIVRRSHGGVSAARNAGIVRATGAYVGFIDADDTMDPDWLLQAIKAISDSQADLVRLNPWCRAKSSSIGVEHILEHGFSWLSFVRKDALLAMSEPFPVGMRIREDTIFHLKLLNRGVSTSQRHGTGYHYRLNTDSSVYRSMPAQDFVRFVREMVPLLKGASMQKVSRTIYKTMLWWRVQRNKDKDGAESEALVWGAVDEARTKGVLNILYTPLLWTRNFILIDPYLSLRRRINPKWLP